jgi:rSAM/selenodomain-associated transferase 1
MSKCGVGVMARAPSAAGKTRLAPHLSPPRLAALRAAMLADTLDSIGAWAAAGDDVVVFFTPAGTEGEIAGLAKQSLACVCQPDGDLGRRMRSAFEYLLGSRGCDVAILVGSDIPLLSPAQIDAARDTLRSNGGVVVGPADDGGYYLIGMTKVCDGLFEQIEWGTGSVLTDTLRAAEQRGIEARLVGSAYDIDTIDDVRRLERDLEILPSDIAPHVRRWFLEAPSSGN